MFSFLLTQTSINRQEKKSWSVSRRSCQVFSNLSDRQNQAYRFSSKYYLSNFLDIQKQSFQSFLKTGLIQELKNKKIHVSFDEKENNVGLTVLFYPEWYKLIEPKLTVKQAIYARKTYSSNLYVPIKILNEATKSFIFDWFHLATIPLMTSNGHFIVNGLPRMVMSQIVRSPGIYFKKHFRSESLHSEYYTADFIAHRGTWLRFETDLKEGTIWVKMKNEPKMSFMHFFQFVGLASPVLSRYYSYLLDIRFEPQEISSHSFLDRAYVNRGYQENIYTILLQEKIQREFVRKDVYDDISLDPLGWMETRLDEAMLLPGHAGMQKQAEQFFETFSTKFPDFSSLQQQPFDFIPLMTNTLDWDTQLTYELEQKYDIEEDDSPLFGMSKKHIEDLFLQLDIEHRLKYQNVYTPEMDPLFGYKDMWKYINHIIISRLFDKRTYSLSLVGRAKLNQTLGLSIPLNYTLLTPYDFLFGALRLVQCATGKKPLSDIDNLMNRKIKPVGELIQNQFAVGFQRLEEAFVDNLCKDESKRTKPFFSLWQAFSQQTSIDFLMGELKERFETYINEKPINTALKEFFNSNPLSQMLDQTNPLAEITHKRRLSSLGIGGVSRQNATMDIRGIHPTHYGRICPIETPEGQNAGLVNSFTIYARLNSLGFIETPFYQLYRGFVVREKGPIFFLANHEKGFRIAPGDLGSTSFGFLPAGILLPSRKTKLFERVDRSDLEYIGVHPLQMISIATSLIPFLEHNDGNRALMGSNMQRQSVPTLQPTPPIVGTGLESKVLLDVDHVLQAKKSGVVSYVDSQKICIYSSFLTKTNEQDLKKEKIKTGTATNLMKQALNQKRKSPLQFQHHPPILLKKQLIFNSLCIKKNNPFLSFLSLTQFQKLYQSQLQNDHFGLMQIFDIMEKQKTYILKHNTVSQFKNPFLLALKNRATLDSSQVFLNAAFFALQSVSELTAFSFNACVSSSQPQKQKHFFGFSKQQTSPFAKRINFKMKKNKIVVPFLLQRKITTPQAALKTLSFLHHEFSCFFDPTQTTFKDPLKPNFFLRTRSPLHTIFLPQKQTPFSPLTPQMLFNAITVNKFQTKIRGRWRKKTSTIKPLFCQHGLIKNPTNCVKSLMMQNPITADLTWFDFKQNILKKELFFQKFSLWSRPTLIQTNQIGYFPLTRNLKEKKQPHSFNSNQSPLNIFPKMDFKLMSYTLDKIARSNQDTYLLHRAVVKPGQWVEQGDILADNSSSSHGDLAIGKNLLVGYTPWEGYNFEDAILLSDRVVSQELFTSLHVERYEAEARDTPEGMERITANISSLSDSDISNLDKNGIVKVGTWVTTGDILIGKRTPIDPTELNKNPYQSLIEALFTQENTPPEPSFKDTSLRVPPDVHGWVVHVEIVETIDDSEYVKAVKSVRNDIKKKIDLEKKAKAKLKAKPKSKVLIQSILKKTKSLKMNSHFNAFRKKKSPLSNSYHKTCHGFNFLFFDNKNEKELESKFCFDSKVPQTTRKIFNKINYSTVSFFDLCNFSSNKIDKLQYQVKNKLRTSPLNQTMPVDDVGKPYRIISKETVDFFANDLDNKLIKGDLGVSKQDLFFKQFDVPQLPKRVNVYIAEKRGLQVGDKIAGRHGNKGIISNILPRQDMPYLPDGTPLDLVLNPLGVPSRMNVGQIFECLLGLAGSYLHQTYKIQPFDERYGCEASRSLVYSKLYEARVKTKQNWLFDPNFPGKVRLFDGRTGQCFEQPVTVGKAYILKLIHLVDEKIHARSTGPYSVVTQQPLRGRSKKGGQRVGEMEVWALEGFGAAYILQELLTVKSDDLLGGRHHLVNKIVQNQAIKFGPPESFRVLLRELEALCIGAYVY